jgi:hypothetical protein
MMMHAELVWRCWVGAPDKAKAAGLQEAIPALSGDPSAFALDPPQLRNEGGTSPSDSPSGVGLKIRWAMPTMRLLDSVALGYACALLLFGLGLLGAAVWRGPTERDVARAGATAPGSAAAQRVLTGIVTRVIDCQWANPGTAAQEARKGRFNLASGLLELTYQSGVRVWLGGRISYVADGPYGGCLSHGTVMVSTPASADGIAGAPCEPCFDGVVPSAPGSSPDSAPLRPAGGGSHPLFRIRTPTLIITDHGGSQFGVAVENAGVTIAHVYRGKADYQTLPTNKGPHPMVSMAEGDWVAVDLRPDGGHRIVYGREQRVPPALARRLPKRFSDLLQVQNEERTDRNKPPDS